MWVEWEFEVPDDGYYNIISGEYECSYFEDDGSTHKFYYSDDYFKDSSKEPSSHLRSMSAALAMSNMTLGSNEDVADLLEKTGFLDIKGYDTKEDAV